MGERPNDTVPPVLRVLQSKHETRAFYDKISGVYDILAERSEAPLRHLGLRKLAVEPGDIVLELGPGTGHSLVEMAKAAGPGGHVYGVDLSLGMVAQASGVVRASGLGDRISLVCGDGEHLCIRSGAVSCLFMSFTLQLFDTPAIPRVLSECRRVLRDGGRLVVLALSKEAPAGLAMGAFEWTHRHFPNLLDCRPIYVSRSIAASGFRVHETLVEHMWVPVEIVVATKPVGSPPELV